MCNLIAFALFPAVPYSLLQYSRKEQFKHQVGPMFLVVVVNYTAHKVIFAGIDNLVLFTKQNHIKHNHFSLKWWWYKETASNSIFFIITLFIWDKRGEMGRVPIDIPTYPPPPPSSCQIYYSISAISPFLPHVHRTRSLPNLLHIPAHTGLCSIRTHVPVLYSM